MTALAADAQIASKGSPGDLKSYKVEDNVKIYKGGLVVIDASGYARPARNTAGELVVGIAEEQKDNTVTGHTAGGISVRVRSGRHFLLTTASAAQAWVGTQVFALDDQTARQTVGNGNRVGVVTEYVSATSIWVWIDTAHFADNATFQALTVNNGITITAGGLTVTAGGITVAAGGILSSGATGGVGYATGAGGTVTQMTSKSTGVTLNTPTGQITMNNANLAATTSVAFTLTNSQIAATDVIIVNFKSGNTANSYMVNVDAIAAGSCSISIRNYTAGGLAEAVVLQYAIIKGVNA